MSILRKIYEALCFTVLCSLGAFLYQPAFAQEGGSEAMFYDDPFMGEIPMAEEALRESRGGFNAGGYEIEFAIIFTLVDGTLATLSSDPLAFINGLEGQGFLSEFDLTREEFLALQQGLTTSVIENTQNDVTVSRHISMNLLISNYEQRVALGSVLSLDAQMLTQLPLAGF